MYNEQRHFLFWKYFISLTKKGIATKEWVGLGTASYLPTGRKNAERKYKFSWIDLRGSKVMNLSQIKPDAFLSSLFSIYI